MVASKSFSTRLSLNILFIVSILFIIALGVLAVSSHVLIAKEATKSATNMLNASISDIEKTLNSVEVITQNASWLVKEHANDEQYLYHITEKVVETNPYIIGSAIAFNPSYRNDKKLFSPYTCRDPKTGTFTNIQLGDNYNYVSSEWYHIPFVSGKAHWSEPYFDEGGGECMMSTYSFPIKDNKGKVFAIITTDISLDWLSKKAAEMQPYEHSYTTLASAKGRYLSNGKTIDLSNTDIITTAKKVKDPNATTLAKNMLNHESGSIRFYHRGQVSFAVYGPLNNGWSMAITSQYRDVLQRTSQMHMILILVGLIGLLIIFIICHRTIRQLTQPLTEFSVSALNMAKGNFNAQLPEVKTKDEMLRLHNSLAYMQKSINTYISELRTTTSANERMESELNIARAIQIGMLPKNFPNSDKCHIHAFLQPAKEVGGDLYDFLVKDDNIFFAIGDVSGKGVPAALVMAITRSACHFFSSIDIELDEMMRLINNSISDGNETNMFVTLFAGRINTKEKKFTYCNGGHNPLIVIPTDPNEKPYYHKTKTNIAIGIFPNFNFEMETMDFEPGTKLVLYTDGITEAERINKEQFGEDRLLEAVSSPNIRQLSSEEMTNVLYETVKTFTNGNEQNDDITIMVITT